MALRGPESLVAGTIALAIMTGSVFAQEAASPPVLAPAVEVTEASPPEPVLDETSIAIRDLLENAGNKDSILGKQYAASVVEFYAGRDYAAAWVPDGVMTDNARALIERIQAADIDGLDPSAFSPPSQNLGKYAKSLPKFTAMTDVMLSQAVAAYADAAYGGQVDPGSVGGSIDYERQDLDEATALSTVAASDDPISALTAYNPPHPEFAALRDKLAELRDAEKAKKPIEVPAGSALKLGVEDARVGFLRKRLKLPTNVDSPALFDEGVVEAVKSFQKSARLTADGIVGPRTIAALNADPVDPIPTILVNMEKWRWMPRDFGPFYVRVNVPDFTVNVFKGQEIIHTTRTVVGKPSQQTPIFSDEIEYVIVNPAWNVPASITRNEMLPAARRNPGALSGYQVFALIKGRYRAVDPRRVNWRQIDARKIQIRQPPGSRNALGKVKFMFPNRHSVYLHDTPSKSLFKRDYRAYSHGCIRVLNPMDFAEALLAEEADLNSAYLKSLYGSRERRVNLNRKIPVHVTYFTAWVDDSGTLQTRDDLYGHDRRIGKRLLSS